MSNYNSPTEFIDLRAQQKEIRFKIDLAIKKVLDHGQYIMGPEVAKFEESLTEFTGAKHAITCANGTDAITLVLMAWGIGPGDVVLVPSFTYVATAEAVAQLGAIPFFFDVRSDTFNANPESFSSALSQAKNSSLNVKAVIAVDLFGQPAEANNFTKIAKNEGIRVLIDAAQSFGGEISSNKVGTMGDATTTSFFPAKPLGCYGDGGAIFTDDDDLAEKLNSIRLHGKGVNKYDHVRVGLNSRLDTIQASILLEKLKIFPNELILRSEVARNYSEILKGFVDTPYTKEEYKSAWAQFTIKVDDNKKLQDFLKENHIPSVIYYPQAISKQPGYLNFPKLNTGVPVSENLSDSVLSLPMHPYLEIDSIEFISNKIIDFYA
tara:strand:+ start:288 stop:1421 length:1134 start_codon:yes stop_codon:yes gene_type:complete